MSALNRLNAEAWLLQLHNYREEAGSIPEDLIEEAAEDLDRDPRSVWRLLERGLPGKTGRKPYVLSDEEIFDDPFTFDVERFPNEHVAFGGGGAHYCLGANLARVELRIIFREILSRIGDLQKAAEPRVLRGNFVTGLKEMPVTFTPGVRKHPVAEAT